MTALESPHVVAAAAAASHRAVTLRHMLIGSTADVVFPASCIARKVHSAAW